MPNDVVDSREEQLNSTVHCTHRPNETHRRKGQFFLGGWVIFARKIVRQRPRKTAMLTYKITLPDSPYPFISRKNPGFRTVFLARWDEFRFFA